MVTMNRFLAFVLFTFFVSVAVAHKNSSPAPDDNDDTIIKAVNDKHQGRLGGWTAAKGKFYNMSKKDKMAHLGARLPEKTSIKGVHRSRQTQGNRRTVFPPAFDSRIQWPYCNTTISDVRDQGQCGSCAAHSSASVISDRICIASTGSVIKKISTQDQMSCLPASYKVASGLSASQDLCASGFDPRFAMIMYVNQGIVTGGEYNQPTTGCMPYTTSSYYYGSASGPTCTSCTDTGYSPVYALDKNVGTSASALGMGSFFSAWSVNGVPLSINRTYFFDNNGHILIQNPTVDTVEHLMMQEILTNGPVAASFDVYQDFHLYVSGVYQYTYGSLTGAHALKIIGWGSDGGVNYWLAVNSWGSDWGMNGTVKFIRGINNCNIENYVVSALAPGQGTTPIPTTFPPTTLQPTTLQPTTTLSTTVTATTAITTTSPTTAVCSASFCASRPNGYYALATCYDHYCGCTPESPATPATLLPCPIVNGVQTLFDPTRVQCFAPGSGYCVPTTIQPTTVQVTTTPTPATCSASFCASRPNGYYALAACYQYYCGCTPELPATPATQLPCPIVNGVQTLFDATRVQCFSPSTSYCPANG